MLTGSGVVSFHGRRLPSASYVRTDRTNALFTNGPTPGALLLGERAQPAQRTVLRHPYRSG